MRRRGINPPAGFFLALLIGTIPSTVAALESKTLSRQEAQDKIQKKLDYLVVVQLAEHAVTGSESKSRVVDIRSVDDMKKVVLAVTGITDGLLPGSKVAEFTWHFKTVTKQIAERTGARTGDHRGDADFKLYDDGWRLAEVRPGAGTSGANTRPFTVLSDAELLEQTRSEICAMANAFNAYAVDFNSFYLVIPTSKPPTALDDKTDGLRTTAVIRQALSPIYLRAQDIPDADPYGSEYQFTIADAGQAFSIRSFGKDRRFGGGDDFVFRSTAPGVVVHGASTLKGCTR